MDLSNPTNLLIAGVYYALVGLMAFFSIFAVFILIRRGQSRGFSFCVAAVYSALFLKILSESYQLLQNILS